MNIFRTTAASYFVLDEAASGSGGAPPPAAPSPTPAPAPAGGEGGAAADSSPSDAFEGFGDDNSDIDSIDLGPEASPGPGPSPTPAPAEVSPTPVAPAQAVKPEAAAAPAKPVVPASTEPPAGPVRSPLEEVIEGFKTNSKELGDWSGANLFQLSKEDAEALESNAVDVIPRLMGRVQVEALKGAANLIRNFVPQMIAQGVAQATKSSSVAQEAMNQFYESNPHLNAKEHQGVVDKWAKAFRAANPKASRKEAIEFVGSAVSNELKIAPGAAAAPRVAPFAPARPGGRQPITPQPENQFAGLGMELDDDA